MTRAPVTSSRFGRASAGYVGTCDGWQDFARNGRMTWEYRRAGPGNVALMAELPRRAVLSLPSGKEAKELRFVAYAEDRGKTVLQRLEIHHLLPSERGMVTTLEFLGYDAQSLPANLFDPERARELL